ncbi:MAG: YdeI/OmpD-associated family protein [Bacteroidales bacterium]|jgi:uncharacterized protein YdeI (YjbR/CyaY-like superfamily)|nr:YdeI/OmpD-associated family protein [Bacteroidales bacterium]NLM91972.1 bacteriocin-protection protein [Bacteroidales bacterium]
MSEHKPKSTKLKPAQEPAIFFNSQDEFRKWLEIHHEKETELVVGFYKVDSGKPSMTWPQSVDQALCFGWIDGIRRSIDKERYCIRFTPRKPTSNWSEINIRKVEELTKAGLMKPAGLKAFSLRKENKSGIYSYETDSVILDPNLEKQFKANKDAWTFFMKQAPSYKKAVMRWIMGGVQEKTRQSRLEKTIRESETQKRIS